MVIRPQTDLVIRADVFQQDIPVLQLILQVIRCANHGVNVRLGITTKHKYIYIYIYNAIERNHAKTCTKVREDIYEFCGINMIMIKAVVYNTILTFSLPYMTEISVVIRQ